MKVYRRKLSETSACAPSDENISLDTAKKQQQQNIAQKKKTPKDCTALDKIQIQDHVSLILPNHDYVCKTFEGINST